MANPRTAMNTVAIRDLCSNIFPIFIIRLEHMHHVFVLEVVSSSPYQRKMWLHASRLLRNMLEAPGNISVCGYSWTANCLSVSRYYLWFSSTSRVIFFFLFRRQKNTPGRVTESLFKERRLLHFNYCFYFRVQ